MSARGRACGAGQSHGRGAHPLVVRAFCSVPHRAHALGGACFSLPVTCARRRISLYGHTDDVPSPAEMRRCSVFCIAPGCAISKWGRDFIPPGRPLGPLRPAVSRWSEQRRPESRRQAESLTPSRQPGLRRRTHGFLRFCEEMASVSTFGFAHPSRTGAGHGTWRRGSSARQGER